MTITQFLRKLRQTKKIFWWSNSFGSIRANSGSNPHDWFCPITAVLDISHNVYARVIDAQTYGITKLGLLPRDCASIIWAADHRCPISHPRHKLRTRILKAVGLEEK